MSSSACALPNVLPQPCQAAVAGTSHGQTPPHASCMSSSSCWLLLLTPRYSYLARQTFTALLT